MSGWGRSAQAFGEVAQQTDWPSQGRLFWADKHEVVGRAKEPIRSGRYPAGQMTEALGRSHGGICLRGKSQASQGSRAKVESSPSKRSRPVRHCGQRKSSPSGAGLEAGAWAPGLDAGVEALCSKAIADA